MPLVIIWVPFAQLSGYLIKRFDKYRPLHQVGCALTLIGIGLMTLLNRNSPSAQWIWFQALCAAGLGLTSCTLPAVLAGLEEKDVAIATGTWSFLKSFGIIWGVTIPAVVFNGRINYLSANIDDVAVREMLENGQAYQHGTKGFLDSLGGVAREEVVRVYEGGLRSVWVAGTVVAGLAFLICFLERQIKLRTSLETEFGIEAPTLPVHARNESAR